MLMVGVSISIDMNICGRGHVEEKKIEKLKKKKKNPRDLIVCGYYCYRMDVKLL
jgi:hypothetical protein